MPQDATEEKPLGRRTCDPSCRRGSRPTTDELLPGPASSRRDDDATAMPGASAAAKSPLTKKKPSLGMLEEHRSDRYPSGSVLFEHS